jgi:hypothetical protein
METISYLIVDGILAFLLISVIVVCYFVYRRLGTIKDGQAEMRHLVDQLNSAVVEAQRSVSGLRQSASEVEGRLQSEVRKATTLADELGLITEAGNNLADRIERGLTGSNSNDRSAGDKASTKNQADKKQQKEILAALREAR